MLSLLRSAAFADPAADGGWSRIIPVVANCRCQSESAIIAVCVTEWHRGHDESADDSRYKYFISGIQETSSCEQAFGCPQSGKGA